MEKVHFGEGDSRTEQAVRRIEGSLLVLRDESNRHLYALKVRPESPVSPQHKEIGESLQMTADEIQAKLDNLKLTIEKVSASHLTGQS